MNNWLKGMLYAALFFVVIFLAASISENPYNIGKSVGLILWGFLIFLLGYQFSKKRKK